MPIFAFTGATAGRSSPAFCLADRRNARGAGALLNAAAGAERNDSDGVAIIVGDFVFAFLRRVARDDSDGQYRAPELDSLCSRVICVRQPHAAPVHGDLVALAEIEVIPPHRAFSSSLQENRHAAGAVSPAGTFKNRGFLETNRRARMRAAGGHRAF